MDEFDKRVRYADGQNKIFQYRTRRIVFFFLVVGGIFTILDKCSSLFKKAPISVVSPGPTDSIKQEKSQLKPQTASLSHKFHSRQPALPVSTSLTDKTEPTPIEKPKPAPTAPWEITYSDNIEFKLMNAIGNTHAQTVTITMVLITSAANWYIMSAVKSIFDDGGDEYNLTAYKIGSSTHSAAVNLVTGIPIKCTYTFGGVLPDVKSIKLFKYDYTHKWGEPFFVEFRDVPVTWE